MSFGAGICGYGKNGLSRGHTSVCADGLGTVAGNDVSARNPFVVIARVDTIGITSVAFPNDVAEKIDFVFLWLNPSRCFSAVQTALMI